MSEHTPLAAGKEFDRIRRALSRLGSAAVGVGDDCAFVDLGAERLALSSDLTLEGTHFKTGWLQPVEIGWRATAAALSDLAAVAAQPLGVLLSVALPSDWPEEQFADLVGGAGEAARAVGAVVWGGDLVRGDRLGLDVTVVGRLAAEPVRRSGAAVGDELWVTGALGGPFCAVAAWNARQEPDAAARERFAHPVPRIAEGLWLAGHGARAMIDVSDGLVADAEHLAAASGIGWAIEPDHVPLHPAAEVVEEALVSGEEYELLVALPAGKGSGLAEAFRAQFQLPLTHVGTARREPGVNVLRAGKRVELPPSFAHFESGSGRRSGRSGR